MEFVSKPYAFTVVDSNMDFLVIKNPYCIKCFTHKMNTNILSKFLITSREAKDFKSHNIKCIRIVLHSGQIATSQCIQDGFFYCDQCLKYHV